MGEGAAGRAGGGGAEECAGHCGLSQLIVFEVC